MKPSPDIGAAAALTIPQQREDAPRLLVVTAGPADKRTAMVEAMRDLYPTKVLPGKIHPERRIDRLLRFVGLGNVRRNIAELNRAILREAPGCSIVFIVKGNFVTARTLAQLAQGRRPPRIVGWTCDDIYLDHNNSPILKKAAPWYDIMFTAKSLNIRNRELEQMGFREARYLQQGFDALAHRPMPDAQSRFRGKVVFVGFGENDRFEKMNHLAANGIEVHVYGNGWNKSEYVRSAHPNLLLHRKPLFGDDYVDALCNSAISLCFLRKLNRDLHTSRTFEIPACGGFMLAERSEEHLQLFEEGTEAEFFSDAAELLQKVRFFLAHPEARERIAQAGLRRTRESDYSYHRLAREIVAVALDRRNAATPAVGVSITQPA